MHRMLALIAALMLLPCFASAEDYVPDAATLAVHSAVKELLTREGIYFEADDGYAYTVCIFEMVNNAYTEWQTDITADLTWELISDKYVTAR